MQRSTITVIVLVVVIGGAALGWYITKDTTTTNTNSNITTTNQITNTTVVETIAEQGAIVVERETLYNATDVAITTASIETEFHGQTADEGNQYVVLFFKTTELAGVTSSLANWANNEVSLVDGDGNSYTLFETKSEQSGETGIRTGYLWYQGSDQASNFTLRFGEGEEAQEIDIGF